MYYKIIFSIGSLCLFVGSVLAESELYPTRILTTEERKSQEAISKSINQFENVPLPITKIGTIEVRQLMEPILSYPEGFLKLDPVADILKEENLYSKLGPRAREEALYKKREKIKNFHEKRLVEKFVHFDFRTGSLNNLSNYNIQYLNRHLPLPIDKEVLKKQAFDFVSRGNLSNLRALIENKIIEVNITDDLNRNLLMFAAKTNQIEIVRFLLMHKIDINHQDKYGNSVISYTPNNSVIYNLLIQFGAQVNKLKMNNLSLDNETK